MGGIFIILKCHTSLENKWANSETGLKWHYQKANYCIKRPLLSWAGSDVYLSRAEFLSSQGYELLLAAWLIRHGAGMPETFQTQQGLLQQWTILQYCSITGYAVFYPFSQLVQRVYETPWKLSSASTGWSSTSSNSKLCSSAVWRAQTHYF